MSMLAHGFRDPKEGEFVADDAESIGYAVVRLRGRPMSLAVVVLLGTIIAVIVAAVMLAA